MSATIRIDAEGSAPEFADRVAGAFDRLSLSEGKVKGAMRGISNALDGATSAADLATKGADILADKLVKGVGGAAAVGAGKLIADAMRRVGADLTAAADSASAASKAFNALDFKSAIASSAQMSSAIDKIRASADAIRESPNPFVQIANYATGAAKNMDELAEATERERQALMGLAAQQDRMSAESKVGKTPGQRAEMDRLAQNKKELDQANLIADPSIRERAKSDIARRQAAEEQIKEDDRHAKAVEQVGKEAAQQDEKLRDAAAKGEAEARKIADEFDSKKAEEAKKAEEDAAKAKDKTDRESRPSYGGGGGGGDRSSGMSSRDVAAQSEYGRQANKQSDLATARAVKEENSREAQRSLDETKAKIRKERDAADKYQSHKDDQISNVDALNRQRADREAAEKKAREDQRKGTTKAETDKTAVGASGEKGAAKGKAENADKGLGDIYTLLEDNLTEMRTYAFVK
jgi:hypothetical protein